MKVIKVFICCTIVLSFLGGCSKQEKKTAPKKMDFETLMGKDLPQWKYVHTETDKMDLVHYQQLYEQNLSRISEKKNDGAVPKVIHFIWIGPAPFPEASVKNIESWVSHHPHWIFKFWTDRPRPLPHPKLKPAYVSEWDFKKLGRCYMDSGNYAEKADVLRYEILAQEGGVYADHDVKCLHAFDPLNEAYDFYCGLELPSETCLSSTVHCTNNLIASKPDHPILKACLDWLDDHWESIGQTYPGTSKEAVIDRVAHRSFWAFAESVRHHADGNKDMVFPAFYFNAPSDEQALLARHLYAGTWFENETKFEKMARERLILLSKKINKILLFCGILGGLNMIGLTFLGVLLFKKRAVRD